MSFSGKISFPSKVPEFLHMLFNLVEKHSPVSFFGLNALVQLCCVHCARFDILSSFFSETKCKPAKKIQGECFTTSSKSTLKNSGTFEGKQILPEKVTYIPLAPSHSIIVSVAVISVKFPSLAFAAILNKKQTQGGHPYKSDRDAHQKF